MNEKMQFDYCSKCGALLSNGVCQFCVNNVSQSFYPNQVPYENLNQMPNQNPYQASNQNSYQSPYPNPYRVSYNNPYQNPYQNNLNTAKPKKKLGAGAIVAIVLGCVAGLLLILGLFVAWVFTVIDELPEEDLVVEKKLDVEDSEYTFDYNYEDDGEYEREHSTDVTTEEGEEDTTYVDGEEEENWPDPSVLLDVDGDGDTEVYYEPGLEGLEAEYYATITDYLRYDLSYSVDFMEYRDSNGEVVGYYPYVTGEQEFIDYLNQNFYVVINDAMELGETYDCDASSVPYVTYMDEDLLSVVFVEMYIFNDGTYFEDIYCCNIDMKTGARLDPVVDTSDEFMQLLEERCLEQSTEDATYLFETYTYDELRDIFAEKGYSLVAFYTPLGMELGITYEGYWCCATFKDYEQYVSYEEVASEL